jgi:hypothetical protein
MVEPTHRPGFVRGFVGKVPLVDKIPVIGPAITGRNRNERTPPRTPEPNPDILPPPPPVLFAPPAETLDTTPTAIAETPAPSPVPEAPPAGTPPVPAMTLPSPTATPDRVIVEPAQPAPAPRPTPPVVTPPPVPTAAVVPAPSATTATLDSKDTAMPNPAVEPNELIRMEFENGVRKARAGDLAGAAESLRNYAANHSSSGLAPRALFLAIVFEPDPARAVESYGKLRSAYPDSRYLEEVVRRRLPVAAAPEFTSQDVVRLEGKLASETDPAARLETTRQLGAALVALKQYERARQVVEPAAREAGGTPQEAPLLDLLSECQLARRDMRGAMATLTDLLQRFPEYTNRPRVRLNMGLVSEEAGYYPSALANYRYLIEEAPDSPEARFARERIRDLEATSE